MDGVAWFRVIFIFLCLESALALYMNLTNYNVLPVCLAVEDGLVLHTGRGACNYNRSVSGADLFTAVICGQCTLMYRRTCA